MDKTLVLVDVKMVVVGDGGVGKTSLLISYTKDLFNESYDPTVFDYYMSNTRLGNVGVKLSMWDTPGHGDYDRFRPLAYSSADIFLVCVSINDPMSLQNLFSKWIPEIDYHKPNSTKIIVGTKSDLRQIHQKAGSTVIPYRVIESQVIQRGYEYMQCSSMTQFNLKKMFDRAISDVISRRDIRKPRKMEKAKQQCSLI